MLMVSPSALRTMIEVKMESGIDTAIMTVLRQLPRKTRIMRPVRQAAITASRVFVSSPTLESSVWMASSRMSCPAMAHLAKPEVSWSRPSARISRSVMSVRLLSKTALIPREQRGAERPLVPLSDLQRASEMPGVLAYLPVGHRGMKALQF